MKRQVNRHEVVVIGGGVIGCAVAWYLTRLGIQPLVIDRGGVCGGSSGACMGHLMMMPDPEVMFRLTRRSLDLWKQFHRDVGGFEMRNCGCLWLGESPADLPLLENIHAKVMGYGDRGRILDAAELHALEPGLAADLVGAFYFAEDAVVFPMQAAGALMGAAMAAGAELRHHTDVRGLRRGADGAIRAVVCDRGEIETEVVVNAAGVHVPDICEMAGLPRTPIFPRRGDLAITMPQRLAVRHQMVEVAYLRKAAGEVVEPDDEQPDPGSVALNLQPQGNGTLLIGSSRQFAGYDCSVNPELLRQSLRRAMRFVPELADLQLVRSWAGLRPYTRDKLPIVGPVSGAPGLFLAGGHEGLGVTLAMVSGELIAEAVTGRVSPSGSQLLASLSPDRFAEADRVPEHPDAGIAHDG